MGIAVQTARAETRILCKNGFSPDDDRLGPQTALWTVTQKQVFKRSSRNFNSIRTCSRNHGALARDSNILVSQLSPRLVCVDQPILLHSHSCFT
eukprot:IDg21477t1